MSVIPWRGRPRRPAPLKMISYETSSAQPVVEHLKEFRDRLIRSVIGVVIATALAFLFVEQIMSVLIDLAGPYKVQALDPTETFSTYFKVALMSGMGLAIPVLVYPRLRFLAPGLKRSEQRALYISLPFILVLFLTGAMFCYYVILPSALDFLLSFGDERILKQVSLTKFVGFVSNFMLAVGLTFELPVVLLMMAKLRIVSYRQLAKFRKYAFLLSFLVAALITPTPDPLNQALVAGPLFFMYEVGVQLSR